MPGTRIQERGHRSGSYRRLFRNHAAPLPAMPLAFLLRPRNSKYRSAPGFLKRGPPTPPRRSWSRRRNHEPSRCANTTATPARDNGHATQQHRQQQTTIRDCLCDAGTDEGLSPTKVQSTTAVVAQWPSFRMPGEALGEILTGCPRAHANFLRQPVHSGRAITTHTTVARAQGLRMARPYPAYAPFHNRLNTLSIASQVSGRPCKS
jgi:hypothetical protein